jgi:hypothetical protein
MPTKPKPKPDPLYYGRPTLRTRGWTDALIARFLPEPDLLTPNPHYRMGLPRKLYLITRVEAIEASDRFLIAQKAAKRRQRRAAKAVETKRLDMQQYLDRLTFMLPVLDRDSLIRQACQHYNHRQEDRAMWAAERDRDFDSIPATAESSPGFLARLAVNFLRHEATDYEDRLDATFGRVGAAQAYPAIVARVLDAIAAAYPWLAEECTRQKQTKAATEVKQEEPTDA